MDVVSALLRLFLRWSHLPTSYSRSPTPLGLLCGRRILNGRARQRQTCESRRKRQNKLDLCRLLCFEAASAVSCHRRRACSLNVCSLKTPSPVAIPCSREVTFWRSAVMPFSTSSMSVTAVPTQPVKYGFGSAVIAPKVITMVFHSLMGDVPIIEYISWKVPTVPSLTSNLYTNDVNLALTTDYDIPPDTRNLQVNVSEALPKSLKYAPHLSRDGGKRWYLNC